VLGSHNVAESETVTRGIVGTGCCSCTTSCDAPLRPGRTGQNDVWTKPTETRIKDGRQMYQTTGQHAGCLSNYVSTTFVPWYRYSD